MKTYDIKASQGMTPIQMVTEFHEKFGLKLDSGFRFLGKKEQKFRNGAKFEELAEYIEAVAMADPEEILDALVDLQYFVLGTVHRHGLAEVFDVAFRRVHAANMAKEVNHTNQRRGFELEVTKPADWQPPYLHDLIEVSRETLNEHEAFEQAVNEDRDEQALSKIDVGAGLLGGDHIRPLQTTNPKIELYSHEEARGMGTDHSDLIDPKKLCGLITIDGPDASGKSTLAAAIAELTGGEVIHLTWTPELEKVMNDYRLSAIQYASVLAEAKVVILERPWLSGVIYTSVYRGEKLTPDYVADVEEWQVAVEESECVNLMALPGDVGVWLENYRNMCATREELHGDNLVQMQEIHSKFAAFAHGTDKLSPRNPNFNIYDYQMNPTQDAEKLEYYIRANVLPFLNKKA